MTYCVCPRLLLFHGCQTTEPARLADAEAAAVGLNEPAKLGDARQFRVAQSCIREAGFRHSVSSSRAPRGNRQGMDSGSPCGHTQG